MLISEAFVASYGVMGIGGVIALLIGSLLLVDTSKTNLAIQHSIIYGAAGSLSAIILLIGYFVAREHGRVATTGKEGLIGELAECGNRSRRNLPVRFSYMVKSGARAATMRCRRAPWRASPR